MDRSFRVGNCLVEQDLDRISGGSRTAAVRPQVMEVLVYLASRHDQVIHADDLLDDLWPGKVVTSASIYNCMSELRNAFEACDPGQQYIQTVSRKGYRLVAPVAAAAESPQDSTSSLPSVWRRNQRHLIVVGAVVLFGLLVMLMSPGPREAEPRLGPRSIAVLPFDNMSADPEQEYFSDGISEEILNLLAKIESLKVIARHSSFSFKGKDVDIPTMAEQMRVRYILEGSVRRSGDRVRITAQLVDAGDGSHLWSEAYDRDYSAENLIEIQSDVARAIAGRLRVTLSDDDEERLARVPTENTDAYTAYLLGRERLRDRKVAELRDAVGQFARAIELDSKFAHAYAGLADACFLYWRVSGGQVSKHCPFAEGEHEVSAVLDDVEQLVRKALSIDNEVGEAWVSLGATLRDKAFVQGGGPDVMGLIREAQAAFKKGIDLSPSFSPAYNWYVGSLTFVYSYDDPPNGWLTAWESGHWQSVIERGLEVDPLSLSLHGLKAGYPAFSSTREEAVAHAQRVIEIAPDSPLGYAAMAEIQTDKYGRLDEAIPWWKKAAERDSENPHYQLAIADSYCALGDAGLATAYAQQAAQRLPIDQRTANPHILIIEACELLLSGDVYSGRLEETLQKIEDEGFLEPGSDSHYVYLELRAMIDIAAGRAEAALARYEAYWPFFCYDYSGDELEVCHNQAIRVIQAAGHHERARKLAEQRLEYMKPWVDRYPAYWTSLDYAEALAVLGRNDEALDVLEAVVAAGWRWYGIGAQFALDYDIAFDSIRDHPRFQALIAAIRADFAQQLENVRVLERRGELPILQEVQIGVVPSSD
jgi:TolB-like protein/DNA-binding winged helix-turn-helix (wHTH) protein